MRVLSPSRLFAVVLLAAGGASLAGGCGASINIVECDEPEQRCGSICTDTDTDPKHCGGCFSRCVGECVDGECAGGEGGGGAGGDGAGAGNGCGELATCDGACVDTDSDEANCGSCGVTCFGETFCTLGTCNDSCPLGTNVCGDICTNLDSDPFNCGGCGIVCASGFCAVGDCVDSCPPNLTDCDGGCVDLSSDEQNCGGCFFTCGPNEACENFSCGGSGCDLECGFCQIVELPSSTFVNISGSTSGSGDGGTSQCSSGEPGSPDVAHRFLPPISGRFVVDTFGSAFDTVLSVQLGCGKLTCNDDVEGNGQSQVVVDLNQGQEVFFIVDGFAPGSFGSYQLNVRLEDEPFCPPDLVFCDGFCTDIFNDPSNCGGCFVPCDVDEACFGGICECIGDNCNQCDDPNCGSCTSPIVLPSLVPLSRSGTTDGLDDGHTPSCVDTLAPEQPFFFEAPFAANFRFDTFGSSFDTVLSVRQAGSCSELACNDDFSEVDSFVEVPLAAGQQVVVMVDGYGQSGPYQFNVDADVLLCAPVLAGDLPIVVQDTTAGQPDNFATSCVGGSSPDRTFHFVAPTTKLYVFDMEGSSYDTTLEIFNGTCGGVSLGCSDDFKTTASYLELQLTEGQLVTILVDGYLGDFGDFRLSIE